MDSEAILKNSKLQELHSTNCGHDMVLFREIIIKSVNNWLFIHEIKLPRKMTYKCIWYIAEVHEMRANVHHGSNLLPVFAIKKIIILSLITTGDPTSL